MHDSALGAGRVQPVAGILLDGPCDEKAGNDSERKHPKPKSQAPEDSTLEKIMHRLA